MKREEYHRGKLKQYEEIGPKNGVLLILRRKDGRKGGIAHELEK